jgi:16S rRNA processing protein RimM
MYIIGKVLKPQGIKGEVKAEIITSFPEHFNKLTKVFIDESAAESLLIENRRFAKSHVYLKFKDINSRNEAEKLRNSFLYIPESELHSLSSDEFYIHDLIGLKIYSTEEQLLGEIKDVESYPANDIFVFFDKMGIEQRIPIIKDVIKDIDLEAGKVTINVIEGLFE